MAALINIEGIGEAYAERLAEARIGSTQSLLKRGATRKGRKEIAKVTGLSGALILSWVNKADLFRIYGVAEEYSDLLEASSVDTVVELSSRNPEHLHAKLVDVAANTNLVRRVPSLKQVKDWVRQAKKLPRSIEY